MKSCLPASAVEAELSSNVRCTPGSDELQSSQLGPGARSLTPDQAGAMASSAPAPPCRPQRARRGPPLGRSHSGEGGRVASCFPREAGAGRFVEQMRSETWKQVSVAAAAPEGVP